jgi:hemolysin-activating ACP:hemolysin acyltransferase
VLGYFGWALYDDEEAERFATTGVAPSEERASGGTVLWVMTAAAVDRTAFFTLVKATRALYPNHRVMAVRNKATGRKITFDQSRARVRASKTKTSRSNAMNRHAVLV